DELLAMVASNSVMRSAAETALIGWPQIHFNIATSNQTYYARKLLRFLYMPNRYIREAVIIQLNGGHDKTKPGRRSSPGRALLKTELLEKDGPVSIQWTGSPAPTLIYVKAPLSEGALDSTA
ncbi:hypothetical protein, partial [Bradyrhizobium sp. JR1.1]|uniref:hypothetical protein n=1 Tax=Bradyrhizobium sp. JR1.1 TaxID=3156366 RepID=UPI0033956190